MYHSYPEQSRLGASSGTRPDNGEAAPVDAQVELASLQELTHLPGSAGVEVLAGGLDGLQHHLVVNVHLETKRADYTSLLVEYHDYSQFLCWRTIRGDVKILLLHLVTFCKR